MKNKNISIILFVLGLVVFAFGVATAKGWQPFKQPTPTVAQPNIINLPEVVITADLPPQKEILLSEMVIKAPAKKVQPGAARKRVAKRIEDPVLEEALEESTILRNGHAVRSAVIRTTKESFSLPSLPSSSEHETFVLEAK